MSKIKIVEEILAANKVYETTIDFNLKVSNVICSVCGCILSKTSGQPCEHLLKLAKDINNTQRGLTTLVV